jgi:hypothetical protein
MIEIGENLRDVLVVGMIIVSCGVFGVLSIRYLDGR